MLRVRITVKWSPNVEAVRSRIRRLPQLGVKLMESGARWAAADVRERFQTGIAERTLKLKPLRPGTIERKERLEFERPEHPLYGLGFDDPSSYLNALRIAKTGPRTWTLRPRDAWHHGRKRPGAPKEHRIKLKDLFDVHEYGATITNGFGRGILIRIPPRPARRYAFNAHMRSRERQENVEKVRKAIRSYVRKGQRAALDHIREKQERAAERAEVA